MRCSAIAILGLTAVVSATWDGKFSYPPGIEPLGMANGDSDFNVKTFGPSKGPPSDCISVWHPPHPNVYIDDCDNDKDNGWHWVHPGKPKDSDKPDQSCDKCDKPGKDMPGKDMPDKGMPSKDMPDQPCDKCDKPGKDMPGKDMPDKGMPGKICPISLATNATSLAKTCPTKACLAKTCPTKACLISLATNAISLAKTCPTKACLISLATNATSLAKTCPTKACPISLVTNAISPTRVCLIMTSPSIPINLLNLNPLNRPSQSSLPPPPGCGRPRPLPKLPSPLSSAVHPPSPTALATAEAPITRLSPSLPSQRSALSPSCQSPLLRRHLLLLRHHPLLLRRHLQLLRRHLQLLRRHLQLLLRHLQCPLPLLLRRQRLLRRLRHLRSPPRHLRTLPLSLRLPLSHQRRRTRLLSRFPSRPPFPRSAPSPGPTPPRPRAAPSLLRALFTTPSARAGPSSPPSSLSRPSSESNTGDCRLSLPFCFFVLCPFHVFTGLRPPKRYPRNGFSGRIYMYMTTVACGSNVDFLW
ncbi:hypothetical protein LY76DRAFT_668473 [Colletotrichum caudatum]|nr:hypothetical protein LY76DRAFT_668473 [Colletotrichum caudatum]